MGELSLTCEHRLDGEKDSEGLRRRARLVQRSRCLSKDDVVSLHSPFDKSFGRCKRRVEERECKSRFNNLGLCSGFELRIDVSNLFGVFICIGTKQDEVVTQPAYLLK